jgi:alpha-tubulin suppressor-like RCC1 family protein
MQLGGQAGSTVESLAGASPVDGGGEGGASLAVPSADGGVAGAGGRPAGGAPNNVPAFALTVGYHMCALFDGGQIKCWGNNSAGDLGLGDVNHRGDEPGEMGTALPLVDLGGPAAVALAHGYEFNCALLDTGDVKCWGFGSYGNLGLIPNTFIGDQAGEMGKALPIVDLGGESVFAVAVGLYESCAILDSGSLKCWGQNAHGELGLEDANDRGDEAGEMGTALPAVALGPGRTASAVVAGFNHVCALLDDATLKCWGQNDHGELGRGDVAERGSKPGEMGDALAAIDFGVGRSVLQVSAGWYHTCVLLDDQQVKCWGDNSAGQLGYGDAAARGDDPGELGDNLAEVDLGTGRKALAVSAGGRHTCVLLDNGRAKCWGMNDSGQLGLGDTSWRGDQPNELGDALPDIDVGTGRTAYAIVAGDVNTCAVLDDGTARCWGQNGYGELGLGDAASRGDDPGELGDDLPPVDFGR